MSDIARSGSLAARRVKQRLHQIFGDTPALAALRENDEKRFLTRSYMALALMGSAPCSKSLSVQSISDGYDDDGVDCVFFDRLNKRLYLGQSKWFSNTNKGVELSDFTRFRDGVERLINATFDKRNSDLHRFKTDVESALNDIDTQVCLLFAHNSEHALSDPINGSCIDFLHRYNSFDPEFLSFREINLKQASEAARSLSRPENIDVEAFLRNWGRKSAPFEAIYGSISATDLVAWYEKSGKALFAENLRYGIERSDVNEGIAKTARFHPDYFWYFNNGITAICDSFKKKPLGGDLTDSGIFEVKRISIINGAQTISSLFRAKSQNSDLTNVTLQLRIISLAGTPEGFSVDVTTANNTQNDLSPVDFVAADENQDRIRRDCAAFGVSYTYRRGDDEPDPASGFGIRDATVAAACASGDLKLAVSAKRYISGLWENTQREPYTKLFNDGTSAWWLWNAVRIARSVDEALNLVAQDLESREHLIAIHSNRFILYMVFNQVNFKISHDGPQDENEFDEAISLARSLLVTVTSIVGEMYPDAYPGNIFKNTERQIEVEVEFHRRHGLAKAKVGGEESLLDFMYQNS